jgi:hypothetical protein
MSAQRAASGLILGWESVRRQGSGVISIKALRIDDDPSVLIAARHIVGRCQALRLGDSASSASATTTVASSPSKSAKARRATHSLVRGKPGPASGVARNCEPPRKLRAIWGIPRNRSDSDRRREEARRNSEMSRKERDRARRSSRSSGLDRSGRPVRSQATAGYAPKETLPVR